MSDDLTLSPNPRVAAFLAALPLADDQEFVTAPGIGVWRARHVRRGLERGVIVVHWTGLGLAIAQPSEHGVCGRCRGVKGTQPCEHCACAMCSWFRQSDERQSPRVSREKLVGLAKRMQAFRFADSPAPAPALDDDL